MSAANPTADESALRDPMAACTPLPDKLGPVFAKELRQGLRAQRFVTPFVAVQIFAIVAIGADLGIASATDSSASARLSRVVVVIGAWEGPDPAAG